MPTAANDRTGRPRRRCKAIVHARDTDCGLCGLPVLKHLASPHPLSPAVDELVPVLYGGSDSDPDNCHLVCRVCNGSRGTKPITPEVQARCLELSLMHRAQLVAPDAVLYPW